MRRMSIFLVAAVAVAGISAATPGPASAGGPPCLGQPATIVATSGDVVGTAGDDVIIANDLVREVDAGDGDDLICVTDDAGVNIDAGAGNDVVQVGPGVAQTGVQLGPGSDIFSDGSSSKDTVFTEDFGYAGANQDHDVVDTGGGNDLVYAQSGYDDIATGWGRDAVSFSATTPVLGGSVHLETGRDVLVLDEPRDRVVVDGRQGMLSIGASRLVYGGGQSFDLIARSVRFIGSNKKDVVRLAACRAALYGNGGDDRFTPELPRMRGVTCAHVRVREYGGAGDDNLLGWSGDDVLIGGPGHDRADGRGGRDVCRAEVEAACER